MLYMHTNDKIGSPCNIKHEQKIKMVEDERIGMYAWLTIKKQQQSQRLFFDYWAVSNFFSLYFECRTHFTVYVIQYFMS